MSMTSLGVPARTTPAARQAASTMSVGAVRDPVWERAIRVLALLDPTVSKTVGLPDARSSSMVSKRASPSVKLSR